MFDKFGEFDSYEEINRAAAAQLAEGDTEAIYAIAKENGIDKEDADDYIKGVVGELTSKYMAAFGKIEVEAEDLGLKGVLADWVGEITGLVSKEQNEGTDELTLAIRKKGKALAGYIALTVEEGFKNRVTVDKRIVDMTKDVKSALHNHPLEIGTPDRRARKKLIYKHYLGKEV